MSKGNEKQVWKARIVNKFIALDTGAQFYRASVGISIEQWMPALRKLKQLFSIPQVNQLLGTASENSFLVLKPWVVPLKCVLHPNTSFQSQSLQMLTGCVLWHAEITASGM